MSEQTLTVEEQNALNRFAEWGDMWDDGTEEALVCSAVAKIRARLTALQSALVTQTRHATTLGAALTGHWQEDAWTDLPQLVYRPSCRPAPQRMESML